MAPKTSLKLIVAFGILAILLIFLGVNYVPRIFAANTTEENLTITSIQTRPEYLDELNARAIVPQLSYGGSDWFERHTLSAIQSVNYAGSDWFERHPVASIQSMNYTGSDWFERHPVASIQSMNYTGSDWIDRHPSYYYINSDWTERHPR